MKPRVMAGGVVPISGEVAAILVGLPDFDARRVAARGTPAYEQMMSIYRLGLANSVPRAGTGGLRAPTSVPDWLSVEQAAEKLGITARAVTKRLSKGQLEGAKSGSRWRVSRQAVERQLIGRTGHGTAQS